jgi:PAS domain S-box-containing protein
MLDVLDPGTFYFHYDRVHSGRIYRVGFDYDVYRLALHRFVGILAVAVIGVAALLLLVLPLVFGSSLLGPLRALLEAVRQVESGNYDVALPLASADEVGDLARGYNRMVGALRGAEGNFRALAENANDAILLLSANGTVAYANTRASAVSGYPRAELVGRSFLRFVPPSLAAALEARFRGRIEGQGLPPFMETVIVTRSGEPRDVEVTGARTEWHDQPAVVVVVRDVSERRRTEETFRRQQEQLLRAEKLAAIGGLVAGVAHEVSNPNQVIGLDGRLLEKALPDLFGLIEEGGQVDPDAKVAGMGYPELKTALAAAAREIQASSARIDRIVSELKGLASGAVRKEREPTDLDTVVQTVAALSQHLIAKATDRFRLDLGGDLPPVLADRVGLEQVMLNLVQNACQALPDRERGVRVRTRRQPEVGAARAVVVEVSDEGVGIRPEDVGRLTEAFYTTRRGQGGTGLGLSVSDRIVREHGGELRFSSIPGRGTTATLTLPVTAPAAIPGSA